MKLRQLVILLFSAAVLSGLVLLVRLFVGFQFQELPPITTFLQSMQAAPLAWGYALVSGILFIGFLIWLPYQIPVWRFHAGFRQIDSATLDTNTDLCRRFYHAALAFRCRYGSKRFIRDIIDRVDFFYDYHNDALRWMNEIVNSVPHDQVPADFIVASICSGQTGRIYSGSCYGGGLNTVSARVNEPVYLHARLDSVEIWSATSSAPICVLNRQPLKLEQGQRLPGYLSCYLSGLDKFIRTPLRLELRCPTQIAGEQQSDESYAREELQAFRTWIDELASSIKESNPKNFGIDVAELDNHEEVFSAQSGVSPLYQQLQQLLGSHIDGFFTRATLPVADSIIAPDAVVLCSGLGIVTITDIPRAGSISYSGDHSWTQFDKDNTYNFDNACMRAQRAKTSLANLLSTQDLIKWPIHHLVVFSHPAVTLNLAVGKQRVQCDVIKLAQLPSWFAAKSLDDTIRFNKDDYNRFIALLDPARVQVIEQTMRA